MANSDKASGFTPIGTLSGSDYHGKMRRVAFAAGDAACFSTGNPASIIFSLKSSSYASYV